ncbi:MAG TPA: carbohydrate kinase family protein [Candidatus Limnocylindria bacterium]|nr:carbohydrate kinase family protein [Candidatus Limnocylindria bacterium]
MTNRPTRVTVIGDSTLDITVLDAVPVPGRDHPAQIIAGPGGQGANVAVRLARQGVIVTLVTAVGTDPAGQVLSATLEAEGVRVVSAAAEVGRSGAVVALVDRAGERAMLSDRLPLDSAVQDAPAVRAALTDADWIHLSGYPLADPQGGAALAKLAGSRPDRQRCSIAGGSFHDDAALTARIRTARPDLVVFDRAEAATILGSAAPAGDRAAGALATALVAALGGVAIVTDGASGAAAAATEGAVEVRGRARSVLDATGAGDAFAASLIAALSGEGWPPSLAVLQHALENAAARGADVAGAVGAQARLGSEAP